MTGDEALVLDDIHRHFGATAALAGASLRVRRGTVHALLGENGAGKTTLMRIAFGLLAPDRGEVRVEGTARRFHSSADAIAAGLGMVHQHFMLVPAFTVAENVALGGRGRFSADRTDRTLRALADRVGLPVDPAARVTDLSVGEQQRVEILKALAHDARLLILDEPTAVLPPERSSHLLAWVRGYVAAGGTVVLITHKLREALAYSDDVTVLRRGRTVLHSAVGTTSEAALVEALTGGAVGAQVPQRAASEPRRAGPSAPAGGAVLSLASVSAVDGRGITRLREASLEVRGGEVLGVIGVEGSGHRELLRLLAGRIEPASGTVTRPTRVGFVPEDRLADALVPEFSLTENLALADAGHAHGVIDWTAIAERTTELLATADVRAPGAAVAARTLSGGNQQKFVVARERANARDALVAEHPTRGLDLQASARVLDELRHAASRDGLAVVVHSPDLDEVLSVATRVVACFGGRVRDVPWPADRDDREPFARALVGAD